MQGAALLVIFFALTSCSKESPDATKDKKSSANDAKSGQADQDREKPSTSKDGLSDSQGDAENRQADPERGNAKDAVTQTDEPTNLETLSYDAEASAFVFYDEKVSLKPSTSAKMVTLKFIGGFAEDSSGKVRTSGTVYQGPKCNDKHGDDVHGDLLEAPFNDLYFHVSKPRDRVEGKGISECYKQVAVTERSGSLPGETAQDIYQISTEPAAEPTRQTMIMVSEPTDHAKNSDARLGSCKAIRTKPQTGYFELKAKISVEEGGGAQKLKIQFWDEEKISPNKNALSEAGLAKIKKALGLKTYSKSQVQESNYSYNPSKIRGSERSPLRSNGDCFKYLYARQLGVNYDLTIVAESSPSRYVPRSQPPNGATIAAHKTLPPKSATDARPSESLGLGPRIIVTYKDDSFVIGTKAVDQLLQSIDSSLDIAGPSTNNDLITAMGGLAKVLEMRANQ